MFEFMKPKAELIEFKGRQLVFLSRARYDLRRSHAVRIQLQANQPARTLDVRVDSSRQVDDGFIYVGRVRGVEPAAAPVRGRTIRGSARRYSGFPISSRNFKGRTIDFSERGFQAELQGKVEAGQKLDVEFALGDGALEGVKVTLVADVRWVRHVHGIGAVAGFRIVDSHLGTRESLTVLQALQNGACASQVKAMLAHDSVETKPEDPCPSEARGRDLRSYGVKAVLNGFSWDGPEGGLTLRFRDQKGRRHRLVFPKCQQMRLAAPSNSRFIASLVECEPGAGRQEVSTVADLTSSRYQLRDSSGDVILELVSQQFKVVKERTTERKVVAFRRRKAAGF